MADTDAWGGVAVADPAAKTDEFGGVAVEQPPEATSWWDRGAVKPTTLTGMGDFGKVGELAKASVKAFGHGFEEGFGPERIGLTPENAKILQQYGVFAPEGKSYRETGWRAPFYAMNDILVQAVAVAGEGTFRTVNATYRGLQQIGLDAGLQKDVVSIPDAFMGSPHPMGVPKIAEVPRIKKILVDGGMDEAAANKVANFVTERAPEKIEWAAIKVGDDIYKGSNHITAGERAAKHLGISVDEVADRAEDGFLTTSGRFVDRAEAGRIVDAADQSNTHPVNRAPELHASEVNFPRSDLQNFLGALKEETGPEKPKGQKPTTEELGRAQAIMERARDEAVNGIDAYHGSPHDFEAFDLSKIGTGEGAQVKGHGLYFAEQEAVGRGYMDAGGSHRPGGRAKAYLKGYGNREDAIAALEQKGEVLYPTDATDFSIIEALKLLKDPTWKPESTFYKTRINANREHLLDLDKPLTEQTPHVQDALKRALRDASVDGKYNPQLAEAIWEKYKDETGDSLIKHSAIADTPAEVSAKLNEVGIPGSQYLDQGSRADTHRIVQHDGVFDLWGPPNNYLGTFKTEAEAKALIPSATSNFVIFDDKLIDITHKNGEPLDLKAAVDLGVVGPDRPPITEGKPADAAKRAVAAERAPDEKVTQEIEGTPNAWRERFDGFVAKLTTPEDAKALIRNAADENGEFQAARQGDIPLKQVEDLAAAAGVDASTIDRTGVGRLLQNDNQVRNAMQAMLTATENVKTAAREVKLDASPANLMKLQEAMLRRDTWVEQVVGHRAEWGRTGNVFQEFLERVKNEESFNEFLKDQDRTPNGLKKIADMVDGLDGSQAARLLNDANKPTFWDKALWYWVNALISGPVTHAKYIVANAAFGAYESAVVTPVAGVIGTARRAVTGNREGVFVGEAAARVWGLVAGTPDAILAAARAARTGLQTALPGEVAQGIIPKQNRNIAYQQKPIPGVWGTIIGLPSRGASGIHSFFNFLGYRASMEAQAYRAAAKDGFSVKDEAFWQRRAEAADAPTKDMMNSAVEEGYRLTYITELGPGMKKVSELVNTVKPLRLIMPFVHIPFNVARRALEGTPLAFLDRETNAALAGKHGAVKQDMAAARLIAGGAVGAYVVNLFLNDRISGFGPTERKERDQWLATGHMPYGVRIGDEWYSFNRFGSLGTMLGLYSNLAEIIPHMEGHDEDLTKAVAMVVHSTGRLLEDEVGMQGLAGLIEAINEPERKGSKFVAAFVGSWLPVSSMQRQIASSMDPHMREAKTFVDGLRYYIPAVRQGLLVKRDWLGEPIANAGYGGDLPVPGVSSIIQHRAVSQDPLAYEMKDLDLHPAAPQDRVGGVKLPPKMYDQYQSIAGAFTRQTLESIIAQDGWENVPKFARQEVFRNTIRSTRQAAAAVMQARNPELIRAGIEQRMDQIQGRKPTTKLQDARE